MNKRAKMTITAVIAVGMVGAMFVMLYLVAPCFFPTRINLPAGQPVMYNTYYDLRYLPCSNELQVHQLFRGPTYNFTVVQGATYAADGLRITITEVHSDYISVAIPRT